MKSMDILRICKGFPSLDGLAAGQQRASRGPLLEAWQADVELRPVGEIGAAPDQDHVAVRALLVDVTPSILAGDPFALAGRQRNLAVDRQRQLERDPRPPKHQPGEPAGERAFGGFASDAEADLDAGGA